MSETNTNALNTVLDKAGLVNETKVVLHSAFSQFYQQVDEIKALANDLVVTNETQTDLMAKAGEMRKKLVKVRTQGVDAKHKELKADSLAYSKALDEIKRTVTGEITTLEEFLREQETFKERKEAERREQRKQERIALLAPYEVDTQFMDLSLMPDENFDKLLNDSRLAYDGRIAEAKRLEEERIERERLTRIHNERKNEIAPYWNFIPDEHRHSDYGSLTQLEWEERLNWTIEQKENDDRLKEEQRVENERLRKEAEEREAEMKKEREQAEVALRSEREKAEKERKAAEAKAKAERDEIERKAKEEREKAEAERKRLEDELKAKQREEQEAKDKAAAEEEARLSMGDKAKFEELISEIDSIKSKYTFKSKKNQKNFNDIVNLLDKVVSFAKSKQ